MGFVRRRTRRRTAMVVGGMAYERGKRANEEQAAPQEEYAPAQPVPPAPPPPAPTVAPSNLDQLKELGELHASGTLTDAEFEAEKARVLGAG